MDSAEKFRGRFPYELKNTNLRGAYAVPLAAHVDASLQGRLSELALDEGKRIHPELEIDRVRPRRKWLPKPKPPSDEYREELTNNMWAGCVYAGKWKSVTGTWKVPAVNKGIDDPAGTDGRWWASSWVGIDGDGNEAVLQIGVDGRVDSDGSSHYYAWYEWYTDKTADSPPYVDPIIISNFPVKSGDRVCGSVEYLLDGDGKPYAGNLSLVNITTGQHFAICLQPPPNVTMAGETCEWIMEDPGGGYPDTVLALFTPTKFTEATCGSFDSTTVGVVGDSQKLYQIANSAGTTVTVMKAVPHATSMDAAYYLYNID